MVLTSFLVGLTLALAGTFVAVLRGVELWRQARRTGRSFSAELDAFEERAVRTERVLAEAEQSSVALQAAHERLTISLARLQVLRAALDANQRRTRWLRVFLPPR